MNMRTRMAKLEEAAFDRQAVVLVILEEDTPAIRRMTEERMREQGHRCIVFGNQHDANL